MSINHCTFGENDAVICHLNAMMQNQLQRIS